MFPRNREAVSIRKEGRRSRAILEITGGKSNIPQQRGADADEKALGSADLGGEMMS